MPDGVLRIRQGITEYEITGEFEFYGNHDELRAIADQLLKRADEVGKIGQGWASCDPSVVLPEKSIKKINT